MSTDWRVKAAARDVIARHVGMIADEIVRQQTPDGEQAVRVDRVKTIVTREAAIRLPSEQLPAIVLFVPSTTDVERSGEGSYAASYRLEVHSVTQSTDADVGAEVATIIATAAAQAVLLALPGQLDGRVTSVEWEGTGSVELDGERDRSRHSSVHVLTVTVDQAMNDFGGPLPDVDDPPINQPAYDPGDLPPVENTAMTTTPVEEIDA
jgi:hypothetical protein